MSLYQTREYVLNFNETSNETTSIRQNNCTKSRIKFNSLFGRTGFCSFDFKYFFLYGKMVKQWKSFKKSCWKEQVKNMENNCKEFFEKILTKCKYLGWSHTES